MDYPPDSRFKSARDEAEFREEGVALAELLKGELGNDYQVRLHLW
ncbi:hypothetical protein OJJOAM_004487 [Cupriavidus sp. H18C1]